MSVTPNTRADDQSSRKSWAQYVQEAVAQSLTRPPMAIHEAMETKFIPRAILRVVFTPIPAKLVGAILEGKLINIAELLQEKK